MSTKFNLRTALAAFLFGAALCACGGGSSSSSGPGGGSGGGSGEALVWGTGEWGSEQFSTAP